MFRRRGWVVEEEIGGRDGRRWVVEEEIGGGGSEKIGGGECLGRGDGR